MEDGIRYISYSQLNHVGNNIHEMYNNDLYLHCKTADVLLQIDIVNTQGENTQKSISLK